MMFICNVCLTTVEIWVTMFILDLISKGVRFTVGAYALALCINSFIQTVGMILLEYAKER